MDKFIWDEDKNSKNLEKHGISFNEACEIFDSRRLTSIDNRFDYGETREISIGVICNGIIVVVVVHTQRNNKIRIISARLANKKERKHYYEYK